MARSVVVAPSDPSRPDYFDGPVAARYDETSAEMFSPEVVEPAVGFLAGLA